MISSEVSVGVLAKDVDTSLDSLAQVAHVLQSRGLEQGDSVRTESTNMHVTATRQKGHRC